MTDDDLLQLLDRRPELAVEDAPAEEAAPAPRGVPGKRTRTMKLPPRADAVPDAPVAQRATAGAGIDAATVNAQMDAAVRPDLHVGSGQPLDAGVRAGMERAFAADFAAVRVHEGEHVEQLGALAFAQGADLHFAPGQYDPASDRGRELLGHELAHVVQQAEGRVAATTQAKGVAVNDDSSLEREADALGARAARGEQVRPGAAPVVARAASGANVQRYAFVNEKQVKKDEAGLTPAALALVTDTMVRNYTATAELEQHAAKSTDYLGNLADGTWLRFSPTGLNVLGENHTIVKLEDVCPAVGSKSFIYEPFSSDTIPAGSEMDKAYHTENDDRFKKMGVENEKDKKQFGAESLFPKMGIGLTMALPYFDGRKPLVELKKAIAYQGQPLQRYVKIAWGHSKDVRNDVDAKKKAGEVVPVKREALCVAFVAVQAKLDAFITALPVDGWLGDELTKKGNDVLLPPLSQWAYAYTEMIVEMAATDPSSRLDPAARKKLEAAPTTSETDKSSLFAKWRNFKFEDSVADAAKRGVRYAGMGRNHLTYLQGVGLPSGTHAFDMATSDLKAFKDLTAKLAAKAVKQ